MPRAPASSAGCDGITTASRRPARRTVRCVRRRADHGGRRDRAARPRLAAARSGRADRPAGRGPHRAGPGARRRSGRSAGQLVARRRRQRRWSIRRPRRGRHVDKARGGGEERGRDAAPAPSRVFEHGIAARQEVDDASDARETTAGRREEAEAACEAGAAPGRTRHRAQPDRRRRRPLAPSPRRAGRRYARDTRPGGGGPEPARARLATRPPPTWSASRRARAPTSTMAALPGSAGPARSPPSRRGRPHDRPRHRARRHRSAATGARPPIGALGTARIVVGAPRMAPVVPKAALRGGVGVDADVVVCGDDGVAHVTHVSRRRRGRRTRSR